MAAGALGSVSNRLRHENGDTHVVVCDDVFSDAGSTPAASTTPHFVRRCCRAAKFCGASQASSGLSGTNSRRSLSSGHRYARPRGDFPAVSKIPPRDSVPFRAAGLLRRAPPDSGACSAASSPDPGVPRVPESPVPARHASPGANRTCAAGCGRRGFTFARRAARRTSHLHDLLRQRLTVRFHRAPEHRADAVPLQRRRQPLGQRHVAKPAAFRAVTCPFQSDRCDAQLPLVQVDVGPLERHDLAAAQSGLAAKQHNEL